MSRRNAITTAIEKVKGEIEFQQRLLAALEATQKATATTKRARKGKTLTEAAAGNPTSASNAK